MSFLARAPALPLSLRWTTVPRSRACSSTRVSSCSKRLSPHKRKRVLNSLRRWTEGGGGASSSLERPRSRRPPASRSSRPSDIDAARRSLNCAGTCTKVAAGNLSKRSSQSSGKASRAGASEACSREAGAARTGSNTVSLSLAGRVGSQVAQCGHARDHTDRIPRQCGQNPLPSPCRTSAPVAPKGCPMCWLVRCRTSPRAVPLLL